MALFSASPAFWRGAQEGWRTFLPFSVGLLPWAIVTGIAMRSIGLSPLEAMGMNVIVFAGTAQLGTLPLIANGAPLWLIFVTALVLNLRFVIFSAALAPAFANEPWTRRVLASYLLVDGTFAVLSQRLLHATDPEWRWGCYLAPSVWSWLVWQSGTAVGVFGAQFFPTDWSLEFMATIALLVMLTPMCREKPMAVAALVAGGTAVLLHDAPRKADGGGCARCWRHRGVAA